MGNFGERQVLYFGSGMSIKGQYYRLGSQGGTNWEVVGSLRAGAYWEDFRLLGACP
jgi:hypothetical protein